MNMMRKGQLQGVEKGDVRGQVTLIAKLFGVIAYIDQANHSILCCFPTILATQPFDIGFIGMPAGACLSASLSPSLICNQWRKTSFPVANGRTGENNPTRHD